MEFKLGDKVKIGQAEGVVTSIDESYYPIGVSFGNHDDFNMFFTEDSRYHLGTPPMLELVERPKESSKVRLFPALLKSTTTENRFYISDCLFEANTLNEARKIIGIHVVRILRPEDGFPGIEVEVNK